MLKRKSEQVPVDVADEARRAKLKTSATLRAQFNYETALARIDHKLDVIEPALKEVVRQISEVGSIPVFAITEGADDGGR